jgi:tetratricopeptide (TPR) repeat protein
MAYADIKNWDLAIADLDEAIRLAPKNADYIFGRGFVNILKGDYDRAIADLTEAIRLDPTRADAWSMRAVAFSKAGDERILPFKKKADYDLAIADDNEAIRLRPDKASYYIDRGNAYKTTGVFDKALADFRQALILEPQNEVAADSVRALQRDLPPGGEKQVR